MGENWDLLVAIIFGFIVGSLWMWRVMNEAIRRIEREHGVGK